MTVSGIVFGLYAVFLGIPLMMWLQYRLSSTNSSLPGLSVIVLLSIVCIGLTIWMHYVVAGYQDVVLTEELAKGNKAEITIQLDRKEEILGASALYIKNEEDEILNSIPLDDDGYRTLITRMTKDYDIDQHTPILHESDIKNGFKGWNGTYNRNFFLGVMVLTDAPLLIIYLLKRRQMKKKRQKEEFKKMKIESL